MVLLITKHQQKKIAKPTKQEYKNLSKEEKVKRRSYVKWIEKSENNKEKLLILLQKEFVEFIK